VRHTRTQAVKHPAVGGLIAALAIAASALLLAGCQSGAPGFDRTPSITSLPSVAATIPATAPAPSAGLDLHLGPLAFGFDCATDSISSKDGGTAAVMCSWKTAGR
jgi:hypothetical protein